MVETVLVTGGTGYIGSFTTLALLNNGYNVIIVDNLYNSSEVAVDRIELISGRRPVFYKADITDEKALDKIFEAHHQEIKSVIHFAALKAVGESGEIPLEYYRVNVGGTIALLNSMKRHNVTNIVFSSSATVYGDATRFENMIPIPEHCPKGPTNTYGYTKASVEQIIIDYITAERQKLQKAKDPSFKEFNGANLRYFNPCGAHPSGLMGEDPQGQPFNLLPILGKVATREQPKRLRILGIDYPSPDGTAIRDYIHVVDLADGHVAALKYLREKKPGVKAWNLGSGKGSSVKRILNAFSEVVFRNTVEWNGDVENDDNVDETDSIAVAENNDDVDENGKPIDKNNLPKPRPIKYLVEVDKDGKPIVDQDGKPLRLLPYVEDVDEDGNPIKRLPHVRKGRRQGDVLDLTANPTLANLELNWKTKREVEEACDDLWFWVKNNPKGYRQDPKVELLTGLVQSKKAELEEAEHEKIELQKAALEKVERKKVELEEAGIRIEKLEAALKKA